MRRLAPVGGRVGAGEGLAPAGGEVDVVHGGCLSVESWLSRRCVTKNAGVPNAGTSTKWLPRAANGLPYLLDGFASRREYAGRASHQQHASAQEEQELTHPDRVGQSTSQRV